MMLKNSIVALIGIVLFIPTVAAQDREPGRHLPKPTEKGIGKIDTRIDNMRYWRRMADSGFVYLAPVENIPGAVYTGSAIQGRSVMFTNSPDVPVTNQVSTQSENSVFVDPSDNNSVMNSNNSTQNPVGSLYGADYLLSSDAGQTWGGSIQGAGGSNSGDPTTAISLGGRRYIGFIDNNDGQSVAYSIDNGASWTSVAAATQNGDLLDKNHMWIDNSPVSPYEGNVYVSYTDFGATGFPIEITRSNNGGLSYSTPISISNAVNAGSHNQGVNIQTGPGGEVYVIWAIYDSWPSDETAIGFAKSTDGGATYTAATRIISNIRGIRTTETSKNHRVNSFPSMAVDISGGPDDGTIYIVWANVGVPGVNTGSDIDVYMIKSVNEGATWTTPVKVNQDQAGLGNEHYFPWITCDPYTGELSVIFYDDRNVASTQCEVWAAVSQDGGDSWDDFKISDVVFTPAPIPGLAGGYMGDYLGIGAVAGKVYPAWPDNRTGTIMTYVSPFQVSNYPFARFASNTNLPCQNDTVIFEDKSLNNPSTWQWMISPVTYAFVDGTGPSSQDPHIKFTAPGDYTISLVITNANGADTLVEADYISVNDANADFSASSTQVIINNAVTFTDQSTCNVTGYNWNFGDGASPATANTQGPHVVTYNSTGLKTVSLTVNGTETETRTNYIEVLPEAYNMSNTTLTTCSGLFYDPQGTSSYLNNQDFTMTIMPADTSKSVRAVFTLFDLEYHATCNYDYLKIYDGPTTSDSLLGTWCGSGSPDTVIAYRSTGALTFEFSSDVNTTGQGWIANLGCIDTPELPPPPPPSYCTAGATTCDEFIERVQFSTIDNSTGCTAGGYNNYTTVFAKLSPGVSYPIAVTNGDLGWPQDQCGIWIDWNQDADFLDVNETIIVSGTPGTGPYTANIVPPASAPTGFTRMRIRIMYTGTLSSCGTTSYGEVEDYGIYVGTPGLWQGGSSGAENDWNVANNWDDGRVPTAATNVIIPEGVTHYPDVSGSFSCLDMEINDGATITVGPGAVMNVTGDLNIGQGNTGTLIINGGTCNVAGEINVSPGSTIDIQAGGFLNDND